jgi:methyl-accepting chemotaxis protein
VLDRLSTNTLLKSVIAVMATITVLLLAFNAWDAWQRVGMAHRIVSVADASGNIFKAMHTLRSYRPGITRNLDAAAPIESDTAIYLHKLEDAEMPAVRTAAELAATIDFPEKSSLVPELQREIATLTDLQKEIWPALAKPKDQRRAGISKEVTDIGTTLLATLDKLSATLYQTVRHHDAFIDEMIEMKQLAWMVRTTGGDASLLISNSLMTGKMSPEDYLKFIGNLGGMDATWAAVKELASDPSLPHSIADAVSASQGDFFSPDFAALRVRLVTALTSGEKPELTPNQWSPVTNGRAASLVGVATAALDAAKQHAEAERGRAEGELATQLILLALAAGLAVVSMLAVTRRVIRPLSAISTAMRKLAGGDLTAEAPASSRRDEIGALAAALTTFKENAMAKARIEEEQLLRRGQAETRQAAIEASITAFEDQMRTALAALGGASTQMRKTSEDLSMTAQETTAQVKTAAAASEDASTNVETVAAASNELSASINEISRQVSHSATIAGRAVEETQRTDSTVQGLAQAAARIGEVVKMISDIAGQTNLLALNATIEAARAGEAGKGFAVVASEVKNLANQTARATEEISAQINAVQNVSKEAVEAIQRIGGTIGEVSQVATSIASAIEEQGAATQEINRNTQEAARRTQEVSQSVAGVATGADATGAAAEGVRSAAEALGLQTEHLRTQVDEFLGKIRAA